MTEWTSVTDDMTTEELVAQAKVPDTSYPHKSECAYILADRVLALSCEVTRMDKRTRHLLDRIDDAEGVIRNWEPDKASDYWLKYPESERGKFTASEGQNDVFCHECIHGIPCKLHDEPPFERVSEERSLTDTVKDRIADPKIVDVDLEDL